MKKLIVILLCMSTVALATGYADATATTTTATVEAAKPVPFVDFGTTAWMIIATALVMLMTIPGLAFFYGGLVRRKNILNVLMQCFIITATVSIQWVVFGYSLSFGSGGTGPLSGFIGNLDWAFLKGINIGDVSPYFISQETARMPHILYVLFQGMFAVITPALIIGAFAERIKFTGFLVFTLLWSTLVYDPIAHWVWSADGWLFKAGALDFAGGTVVHINAGVAALVMAIMIGKRKGFRATAPHNVPFVILGAALLWFGWFGFNAGSALAADGLAASAFLVTHIAAAAATVVWIIMDYIFHKKPTVIGAATGAVAGLVAITPASGFVDVFGALIIGSVVSVIGFAMVAWVKPKLGYDDSLDVFGVHGMGGIWGAIATGIFAVPTIQGAYSGLIAGNANQLLIQLGATGASLAYSALVTALLFILVDKTIGLKVKPEEEDMGLDLTQHNEKAYTVIE